MQLVDCRILFQGGQSFKGGGRNCYRRGISDGPLFMLYVNLVANLQEGFILFNDTIEPWIAYM